MVVWIVVSGVITAVLVALIAWSNRVADRRRYVASLYGLRRDAVAEYGLSVLLPEGATVAQVMALLMVDYGRYEVVVALDGARDEALLRELRMRYGLIAVIRPADAGRGGAVMQALYRSRVRAFRRLVVADVRGGRHSERLDVVTEVAANELLLPLRQGVSLREGSVEWLIAEADRAPIEPPAALTLCGCGSCVTRYLCSAVTAVGGFAHAGRLPRRWLPAEVTTKVPERRLRGHMTTLLVCVGIAGASIGIGWLTEGVTAVTVAGLLVLWWLLLRWLRRAVTVESEGCDWSFSLPLGVKSEADV